MPAAIPLDPELVALIEEGARREASDLHLAVGHPPTYRVHGSLQPAEVPPLRGEDTRRLITSAIPPELINPQARDLDFSMTVGQGASQTRLRVNVYVARRDLGACFRFVPSEVPSFEWMGIPTELPRRIVDLPAGLVLITGVTGSGKTTTLAGLVEMMNADGNRRIVTIEEPIEYLFNPKAGSVITQREVGLDVPSFAEGLRSALREDPDVILCGEIRDMATASMALSAAETGHLVMSTVHTRDAKGAVTRIADIFPADRQQEVRGQLALSLRAIISQHLLPSAVPGQKRILAMEVLIVTDALRAAIRMNKIESIDTLIQTGRKVGMQTLDEHLAALACSRRITPEIARRYAKNPDGLRALGVPEV